jgi:transcription initiation factor TFIIB
MVLTNAHPIAPTCPECGGDTETADGETICAECGLVLTEYLIDHGPEWSGRDSNGESRSRTGAPLTEARHDRGLSTKIGHSRGLTDRQQRMFARLRTHHSRANLRSKRRRNQLFAFSEIRKIAADLGLPTHVRDQACSLFRSAQRADLIRGRTLEGFAAAAVYIAARVGHISRTREEITTAAKSHIPELKVALTAMNRDLGVQVPPPAPKEYLPRFASVLGLGRRVEARAAALLEEVPTEGPGAGRHPSGVAAGCLYTAAKQLDVELTQKALAEVAHISPVTLRNTYQELTDAE